MSGGKSPKLERIVLVSTQSGIPLRERIAEQLKASGASVEGVDVELKETRSDLPPTELDIESQETEMLDYADSGMNIITVDEDHARRVLPTGDVYLIAPIQDPFAKNPVIHILDDVFEEFKDLFMKWRQGKIDTPVLEDNINEIIMRDLGDFLTSHSKRQYRKGELKGSFYKNVKQIFGPYTGNYSNPLRTRDMEHNIRRSLGYYLITKIFRRDTNKQLAEFFAIAHELSTVYNVGRLNAVWPFPEGGRSDGKSGVIREEKRDGINVRLKEKILSDYYADKFASRDIANLLTIRSHSSLEIGLFNKRGVGFYDIVADHAFVDHLYTSHIHEDRNEIVILAPDKGSVPQAMEFAKEVYARAGGKHEVLVLTMDKSRERPNVVGNIVPKQLFKYNGSEFVELNLENPDNIDKLMYQEFFVREDMVDTAGTVQAASRTLSGMYRSTLSIFAEHGMFSYPSIKRLRDEYHDHTISGVHIIDSITQPQNYLKEPWLEVTPFSAPQLALGIERLFKKELTKLPTGHQYHKAA